MDSVEQGFVHSLSQFTQGQPYIMWRISWTYSPLLFFFQWLSRLTQYLEQKKSEGSAPTTKITGNEAAKIIIASPYEPYDTIGFDHVQAKLLDLQPRQMVALVPDDTGKFRAKWARLNTKWYKGKNHPTVGKLVGLNKEEFVIETKSLSGNVVRCHLPRLGFFVRRVSLTDTEAKL